MIKLSPNEVRILELIATKGLYTSEIAILIKKTQTSVRNSTESILTKLDCRRIAQAVYVATKEGIIK